MSETDPDRDDLLRARADLTAQLERVVNPCLARDRNPQLVRRLRAMLAEIDELLAVPDQPG